MYFASLQESMKSLEDALSRQVRQIEQVTHPLQGALWIQMGCLTATYIFWGGQNQNNAQI